MVNAVETKNWNTIKPLRNGFLLFPVPSVPFKTLMGLNDDRKNDG
jgi:hypothetical protein